MVIMLPSSPDGLLGLLACKILHFLSENLLFPKKFRQLSSKICLGTLQCILPLRQHFLARRDLGSLLSYLLSPLRYLLSLLRYLFLL
jgi:hypothetical protein